MHKDSDLARRRKAPKIANLDIPAANANVDEIPVPMAAPLPPTVGPAAGFNQWPGTTPTPLGAPYVASPYAGISVQPQVFSFPPMLNRPHVFVPGAPIGTPLPPSPFTGLHPEHTCGARLYQHPSCITPNPAYPLPAMPPSMGGSGQFYRFGPNLECQIGYTQALFNAPKVDEGAHPRQVQNYLREQREARRIGSTDALDTVGLEEPAPSTSRKRPGQPVAGPPLRRKKEPIAQSYGVVWISGRPVNVVNCGKKTIKFAKDDEVFVGYGNTLHRIPTKNPGVLITQPMLTMPDPVHKNGSDPFSVARTRMLNYFREKGAQLQDFQRELYSGEYSAIIDTPHATFCFGDARLWKKKTF
ncbi:Oidioi.mRNA.OKI2018_I69.chr1.g2770.t1.cds [Oikopleura dioica]|uniref:Oidioi.mRNA.OKI2018_I69.chr1.g2770.t1.cds n=1 Tax=Oikopleura dioica TaxID=34765 RepID=A0ABN7SYI6_OIKDI|nr:Oidioi.mRNA.OKI2018_I69.chr1.g2770.t1.cds [Oikopleura dioica]